MYDWIISNKEVLKIIFGFAIALICFFIVIKTNRLFKLSLHQGIRYFRNAFLFYGFAFLSRYFLGAINHYGYLTDYSAFTKIIFEFFLIMGGFFLLYSLLWKKLEIPEGEYDSSLLNSKVSLFYSMAIVITILDYIWNSYFFMFVSQVILFIFLSIISYLNYRKNNKHDFPKYYFIAMILSLAAWILNSLLGYFNWSKGILINIYIINGIFFLLFLYGVIKLTSK